MSWKVQVNKMYCNAPSNTYSKFTKFQESFCWISSCGYSYTAGDYRICDNDTIYNYLISNGQAWTDCNGGAPSKTLIKVQNCTDQPKMVFNTLYGAIMEYTSSSDRHIDMFTFGFQYIIQPGAVVCYYPPTNRQISGVSCTTNYSCRPNLTYKVVTDVLPVFMPIKTQTCITETKPYWTNFEPTSNLCVYSGNNCISWPNVNWSCLCWQNSADSSHDNYYPSAIVNGDTSCNLIIFSPCNYSNEQVCSWYRNQDERKNLVSIWNGNSAKCKTCTGSWYCCSMTWPHKNNSRVYLRGTACNCNEMLLTTAAVCNYGNTTDIYCIVSPLGCNYTECWSHPYPNFIIRGFKRDDGYVYTGRVSCIEEN